MGKSEFFKTGISYSKIQVASESICMLVCGTKLEEFPNDSCKAPVVHPAHLKHTTKG